MSEHTWILDPSSGGLVVEGLSVEEASALAGDLLPTARELNCARPPLVAELPPPAATNRCGLNLRVASIYHGSVIEGPGRRSVVQLQGCPIRCAGCVVPETHDPAGGVPLSIGHIVQTVLDRVGEPRDGVTVLGGEPFAQPRGLFALLRALKARRVHTTVYSGYTLAALTRRLEPEVREALRLTDLLIDGPYVAGLSDGAGEWRGSRNQRLVVHPTVSDSCKTR